MNQLFARSNKSLLSRWWWTVDRTMLLSLLTLMAIGVMLIVAGSPSVAERIGLDSFYFAKRHMLALIPSIIIVVITSTLSVNQLKLASFSLLIIAVLLMVLTLFFGMEIKGARRWLSFGGISLQAAEFLKPAFCVINGWIMYHFIVKEDNQYLKVSISLLGGCLILLLLQPDLGMSVLVAAIWFVQFFIAGVSWLLLGILVIGGIILLVGAYVFLLHAKHRIDKFLFGADDKFGGAYQIRKSLDALRNGGFWGQGPGEGAYKKILPDAHADFIFSVAGEEFGVVLCIAIIALFALIFFRSILLVSKERNCFTIMVVVGLCTSITLQAIINISSAINLIPTKGMTLPFLSYGGSSLWALAIHMGLLLAFTRRQMVQGSGQ